MSDEHLPSSNTPVFQLLAIIAAAFASAGALALAGGSFIIGPAFLAVAIIIFFWGVTGLR
jgi:fatty acid desaturase